MKYKEGNSMVVKDIIQYLDQFKSIVPNDSSFRFECSDPWHFNISYQKQNVPFGGDSGIYVYTDPVSENWNLQIEHNYSNIWYVGKSEGDIGGRVWAHMGLIYEPDTKEVCKPRFKYNEWRDDQKIPDDIRKSIEEGDVVVYTIKIIPVSFDPKVVEKYLLSCFYRLNNRLPFLNKDI